MKFELHDPANCNSAFKPYSVLVTVETQEEYDALHNAVTELCMSGYKRNAALAEGVANANPNK